MRPRFLWYKLFIFLYFGSIYGYLVVVVDFFPSEKNEAL